MSTAAVLMKDTLVHDGFVFGGGVGDWHVWIGKQPTTPDRCITIYDSGGRPANPRWLVDYPSVQIRVRGGQNDYLLASGKAIEVRNRLLGRPSYDDWGGSGDRIVAINGIGDISFLGWEEGTVRPEFVINLALIVEPSPATTPTNRLPL